MSPCRALLAAGAVESLPLGPLHGLVPAGRPLEGRKRRDGVVELQVADAEREAAGRERLQTSS